MLAVEQLEDPLHDNSHHNNTCLGWAMSCEFVCVCVCMFSQQFYIRKEIFMKCVASS